jgi:FkbM family methyltransferase
MLPLIRSFGYRLRTHPRLGRWALRMIPDVPWTLDIPGIGPFRVRLRRNRSLWLREPMESEAFPFAMLRRLVRPGDVVYDVGANLGLYARYLVATLSAGRVISFEPAEDNRALLARNLELGDIMPQVTVLPFALADEDGFAEFQVDDMQSASGTLSKVTGGKASVGRRNLELAPLTARVACRRLDTVVGEEGLPLPDVIKIDVEGAEALLLRGARAVLRERRPRLLIELHGAEVAREVLSLLDELGYACAGKVGAGIDPSGYARVGAATVPRVAGLYDVHFVAASPDPADLPDSWSPDGADGAGNAETP